ncbi:TDP-N-acetylfucosamine:lipid II N-acetylfucosaminyltransferase [Bordetella bronchialis]|uniref:protein O-GlcNAc transferase n=1 Tax=Bordetella bronchialis TaxID=463025 RepID=A0A193FXW5_9BORD|nr:TDP-N-acetylfucosamine:lipid II N-acetylfucosaminyltransferase [Bordetella bronchialis]ANN71854.1 hypothetical protein BAU08_11420 [Bordetella bronchialis]
MRLREMAKSFLLNPGRRSPASADKKDRAPRAGRSKAAATARELKELGQRQRTEGKFDEARATLRKAADADPADAQPWVMLGYIDLSQSLQDSAQAHFERALELQPDDPDAHQGIATIYYMSSRNESALRHIDRTLEKKPGHAPALVLKVQLLTRLFRMEEATALSEKLVETDSGDPEKDATHWNDLGNIKRGMGQLEDAERCYRKAASLTRTDPVPLSNWLTIMHYMPDRSPLDILEGCKEWARRFAPAVPVQRPVPADLSPGRKLRVGMFSDGFRQHPVGAMTTSALENLAELGFELYLYTTNNRVDKITQRLQAIATRWTSISNIRDEELARRIREDGIDILMDLAGHNAGNRIRTMTLQPAPILMKWVGGLINTTGVEAIDYLLTDCVESPPGSDDFYTEKLVRMPDDYICYLPPDDAPEVGPLPALTNGHITFGCFNNPAKVNEVVLSHWAALMNAIPGSRLYLKGGAYGSAELRQRVVGILERHGIDPQRVRLEGQSVHHELLQCYNQIDIALDPWPYSGGLTTCEALLMGVPVVTLPGPTFAGRHSATHLVNAGMPELVVQDWDQYRARVLDLAGDLQALATIRANLRRVLRASPVCDASRYARHLANALRAVWQRYCEGKSPAALTFTADGQPRFEDEDRPMALVHPPLEPPARTAGRADETFEFTFQGRIVTLDHGLALVGGAMFESLSGHRALQTILIDPTAQLHDGAALVQGGQLDHYLSHVALGDGNPTQLNACLDAKLSGTLAPLAVQSPVLRQRATVLARVPIATNRLDNVDGLDRVEWLTLNPTHDNMKILEGAERLLSRALVVQVGVFFIDVFDRQPSLSDIAARLAHSGMRLLRVSDATYDTFFPQEGRMRGHYGSQLIGANAIFVPDENRMRTLDANEAVKLAFILHSAYGLQDAAYKVLHSVNIDMATRYLRANGWLDDGVPTIAASPSAEYAQPTGRLEYRPEASAVVISPSTTERPVPRTYPPGAAAAAPTTEPASVKPVSDRIQVVDIGANPIDGDPPYKSLLQAGKIDLVGFEPQEAALRKLNKHKSAFETYLPHAVGSGDEVTLYLCHAPGMTSTLRPNFKVLNQFQGYPVWAKILREARVRTRRLDDIAEVGTIDWLKIDIQGGELAVFKNGESKLRDTLVIQTEVNFIQLYEDQPLFAEIDQWMRAHGFMLHTLLEERRRLYAPYVLRGQIHQGLNQLTTADAVYIRDINTLEALTPEQRSKMATILHTAYGSVDLAQKILALNNTQPQESARRSAGTASANGKKRFMHLCYNNIHTQKLITLMEERSMHETFDHQIYIEKHRSIPGYDNDIADISYAEFFDGANDMQRLLNTALEGDVEAVYLHGLFFPWQKEFVLNLAGRKKVVWVIWGGDLYGPIREGKPMHDVVQHISAVATVLDGDYRLFCETYGERPRLDFTYPASQDFRSIPIPPKKSKTIFVGNSGDPGNMHAEILDILARKSDIETYEIVMPLGYNCPAPYYQLLKEKLESFEGRLKARLLTKFLAPEEYFVELARAECLITAHHRQQAIGNLRASLFFGNKTILRRTISFNGLPRKNPSWEMLVDQVGAQAIDYEHFVACKAMSDLRAPTGKSLKVQQERLLNAHGIEATREMLKKQFNAATALPHK